MVNLVFRPLQLSAILRARERYQRTMTQRWRKPGPTLCPFDPGPHGYLRTVYARFSRPGMYTWKTPTPKGGRKQRHTPIGDWCPLHGFMPNVLAEQMRTEAFQAIGNPGIAIWYV